MLVSDFGVYNCFFSNQPTKDVRLLSEKGHSLRSKRSDTLYHIYGVLGLRFVGYSLIVVSTGMKYQPTDCTRSDENRYVRNIQQ